MRPMLEVCYAYAVIGRAVIGMVIGRTSVEHVAYPTTAMVLMLGLLSLPSSACGGRSLGSSQPTDAAALPLPDAAVSARLDAAVLPEACEGPAWAAGTGQAPRPVTVTSARIAMDCCDGATAHFHGASFPGLGFDPVVMLKSWGAWPSPGQFDLAALDPEGGLGVWLVASEGGPSEARRLEGWLRLEGADPYAGPLAMSICVTATVGGGEDDELVGLRLWVPSLPLMPWDWWERFALHRLEAPDLTAREAAAVPLAELVLDPMPLFTLGNLNYYEAGTHTLRFEPWYGDHLLAQLPAVGVEGLPFVVVVDHEPLYLGAFFTALSSSTFGHPVILVEDIAGGAARIERAYPGPGAATSPDPRADPRLLELLAAAAKLAP
ncbi:MAG: hypothetical protein RBU30_02610 [Polyangia bacterium]|nr:hypothetical protein [Polyangia bacterium]